MFQWSKKVVKSVTFNPDIADESLLAQVESYLESQPDKTFSDLCKDALWQAVCVPESPRPAPKAPESANITKIEQQIGELQRQVVGLEERFFAKESNRIQVMESQIMQLTQQVAQLAIMLNQSASNPSVASKLPTVDQINNATSTPEPTPQEVDPVISRLSQFLDDF
ncbi:hypothetical protein B6N60_03492 [Richelia sinica FACHB-800]|uniref:Plasmid segregation centromere-binding protein ParR n=1 Tax=Richelia sinica FACHB-800 TaxID=1357546 RepID=A0A975T9P2_9NOST|nr:plasmid segregation centromere-binding protein ParR [Richelia sinica]MBD2665641.1 plasmid segregation centromere-binding protein ParR [Richelia sinica FACHB-800]QXE24783.1 hypothetical protein B6N60_03492 [Richelia sinica FACHB-800]